MNEREPLSPEAVDALLSAELDGDLEGAARDLGLRASEALAQLGITPGVDARRASLTRARDLIAARPHMELTVEDELVATAMARDDLATVRERRGRRERQWRILVAAGSVAAAIAVIVGISSMNTDSSSKLSSAGTTTNAAENARPATGLDAPAVHVSPRPDLGDVTDAAALRAPAEQLLSRKAATSADGKTESTGKTSAPRTAAQDNGLSAGSFKAALPACNPADAQRFFLSTRPALIATGTVSGAPVAILLYDGSGNPYADVIRVSDCTLVRRQPLG